MWEHSTRGSLRLTEQRNGAETAVSFHPQNRRDLFTVDIPQYWSVFRVSIAGKLSPSINREGLSAQSSPALYWSLSPRTQIRSARRLALAFSAALLAGRATRPPPCLLRRAGSKSAPRPPSSAASNILYVRYYRHDIIRSIAECAGWLEKQEMTQPCLNTTLSFLPVHLIAHRSAWLLVRCTRYCTVVL